MPDKPDIDFSNFSTTPKYGTPTTTPSRPACCTSSGEPKYGGDSWKTGCEVCTCNADTGMAECAPRKCEEELRCEVGQRKVVMKPGASCCGYCEPVTCLLDGDEKPIGYTYRDPSETCIIKTCTDSGWEAAMDKCFYEQKVFCHKDFRKYDTNNCCYTCEKSCKAMPVSVKVQRISSSRAGKTRCSAVVSMAKCAGQCGSLISYDYNENKVVQPCSGCGVILYKNGTAPLNCEDGSTFSYHYKYIAECTCAPFYK
ncbi:integumentary mucin B.1-like [Discoglossus pictus]